MSANPKVVRVQIAKFYPEQRLAFGRAYTAVIEGRPVVDADGDLVEVRELEKAAHGFAARRAIKVLHRGRKVGELVESFVATPEKAAAMGLPPNADVAWWVGVRVDDPETWEAVKARELAEFSFGGGGEREPIARPSDAWVSKDAPAHTNRLSNLDLTDLSLVPQGAGERVPVAITKGRKDSSMDKERFAAAITKALGGNVSKEKVDLEALAAQLAPLSGVMEQISALVDGAHAAGMSASGGTEDPPPKKEGSMDGEQDPPEDPANKEGQDMTDNFKAHPAFRALEEKAEKAAKDAQAADARAAALEAQIEVAKAKETASKRWSQAPIAPEVATTIARAVNHVAKSSDEAVTLILTRDEVGQLAEGLDRAAELTKSAPHLRRAGSSRPGASDATTAQGELEKRAAEIQKANPTLSLPRARFEVLAKDPDLARRVRED